MEEKNRFTEEEYKKKVKEQFIQMLEDDSKKAVQIKKEVDEFVKKLKEKENVRS